MGTRSLRRPVVYSAYRAIALGEHRPPATPLSQRKVLLFRATVAASPQAATEGRQHMVQLPPRPSHGFRSEEHTSALQSLMRTSYAVFCLKKTTHTINIR